MSATMNCLCVQINRGMQRQLFWLLAAAGIISAPGPFVYAQTTPEVIWDGGSVVDDKYVTAENWNPDTVPSNANNEFLQINDGSTALVQAGDAAEGAFLMLGMRPGDSGHLSITGGSMTLGEMRVGGRDTINSNLADWTLGTFDPNGGGTGSVTQTGGDVFINYSAGPGVEPPIQSLYVGDALLPSGNTAHGTYTISGGTLTSGVVDNDAIEVGNGVGTIGAFIQSGSSTVTSLGFLRVGRRGATGTYMMSGGTLNVAQGAALSGTPTRTMWIGDGETDFLQSTSGTFTQTGGTVTHGDANINTTQAMEIGRRSATGVYDISAGSLTIANGGITVGGGGETTDPNSQKGNGTLRISGTASVTIHDSQTDGATGNNATRGNMSIGTANLADATTVGLLDMDGGTLTFTDPNGILAVGNGLGGNGTLDISGGTLDINGASSILEVGRNGATGLLTLSGTGTVNANQLTLTSAAGAANRELRVEGGTLNVTNFNNGTVGGTGGLTRTVNISGGNTTVTGTATGGVNVVWNLTGGTTTIATFNLSGSGNNNLPSSVNVSNTASFTATSMTLNTSQLNLNGGTTNINTLTTSSGGLLYISGGANTIASGAFPGTLVLSTGSTLKTDNAISLASNIALGNATVNVNSGSLALTGPIGNSVPRTLTKTGPGTLTISGTQSHVAGGAYTNSAGGGILNLNANAANLTVNANSGTTNFGVAQTALGAINVNGGTLDVGANNASTAGAVTLTSGAINGTTGVISGASYDMRNGSVSAILGGSGAMTKTTANTITLSGANTFNGGVTVDDGQLVASGATATLGAGNVVVHGDNLGSSISLQGGATANAIDDLATLSLFGGNDPGVADAGFASLSTGVKEMVAALLLNGIAQPNGIYGSSFSAAANQFDEYFAGTGLLYVGVPIGTPGDHNGDGTVDAADYVVWRHELGDEPNYMLWQEHFGESNGGGSSSDATSAAVASVPEPATWGLAAIVVLMGVACARCRPRVQPSRVVC